MPVFNGTIGDDQINGSVDPDQINGGEGDDQLYGHGGDDELYGDGGADSLFGGEGNDMLTGGTGTDTYALSDGSGADTITDFDFGSPKLGTGPEQLDVTNLTSDGGTTPVNTSDVTVSANGLGDAVLTFPGGESVTLTGVAPSQVTTPAQLEAIGIPPVGSTGSDTVPIYDLIQTNGTIPGVGQTLTTSNGDLVGVGEGIVFNGPDPVNIQLGDTAVVNGSTYTITAAQEGVATIVYDGGASTGSATMVSLEMSNGTDTFTYIVARDGQGDFENITSVEYTSFGTNNAGIGAGKVAGDDIVTLDAAAPPAGNETIYDVIVTNGSPATGNVLSVADGGLIDVLEPLTFTTVTAGTIATGDTVVIDGTTWTVAGTSTITADYTLNGGATTGTTKNGGIDLVDGAGNELNLVMPYAASDIVDITSINFVGVNAGQPFDSNSVGSVSDDNVTLFGTVTPPAAELNDVIILSGPAVAGGTLNAGTELLSVQDGVAAQLANAGEIAQGDTLTIGGSDYVVGSISNFGGSITHGGGASTAKAGGITIQLFAGKSSIDILIPNDGFDYTNITSITTSSLSTTTGGKLPNYDTNENVTLDAGPTGGTETIHDAIILSSGTPIVGDVLNAGVELVSVQEPITLTMSDSSNISVGDTINVNGVDYRISDLNGVGGTMEHDGGLVSPKVEALAIQAVSDTKTIIELVVPLDGADYTDITSFTIEAVSPTKGVDPSLLNTDENVTLDTGAPLAVWHDFIQHANPVEGVELTFPASIGGVQDNINILTAKNPGNVEVGDTMEIGGVEYQVMSIGDGSVSTTYSGGTQAVGMYTMSLSSDGGKSVQYYSAPKDGVDYTEITSMTFGPIGAQTNTGHNAFDSNDDVTVGSKSVTETIHDVIVVKGTPVVGDTLTAADGNLVEVIEPVDFNVATAGVLAIGDTVDIGGVTWTVGAINSVGIEYTLDDGTNVSSGTTGIVLTDANNNTLDLLVPSDKEGSSLPEITQLQIASSTGSKAVVTSDFSADGNVTLKAAETTETIYDAIVVSTATPQTGDVLTTKGGELAEVLEPLTFTVATAGDIAQGDTVLIGKVTYTVESVRGMETTYTLDDGSTVALQSAGIVLFDPATKAVLNVVVPYEGKGEGDALPSITQIEVNQSTLIKALPTNELNDDGNVTLNAAATTVDVFDAIRINAAVEKVGVTLNNGTELLSVDEPVQFTLSDPSQFNIGDTADIGGITYTISAMTEVVADVEMDDGKGGTITVPSKFLQVNLASKAGNVDLLLSPDSAGALPDITSITTTNFFAFDAEGYEQITEYDEDSNVTLKAAAVTETIHDAIVVKGTPGVGDTLSTANDELIEVVEPLNFEVATAGFLAAGDTVDIDGVTWTITQVNQMGVDYTSPTGADGSLETVGLVLTNASRVELNLIIPVDKVGDLPDITDITVNSTSVLTQVISDPFKADGEVTLDAGLADRTIVHDAIVLDSDVTAASVYTVADGGLIDVYDSLAFNANTTGFISVGDTVSINSVTWTISELTELNADLTTDAGVQPTKLINVTLSDGGTGTLELAIPLDAMGARENISELDITLLGNTTTSQTISEIGVNDAVTLDTGAPLAVWHDFIAHDQPVTGVAQTVGANELTSVQDGISILTAAVPGDVNVGDTVSIGGVQYDIVEFGDSIVSTVFSGGTLDVNMYTMGVSNDGGTTVEYFSIPKDGTDYTEISSLTFGPIDPTTGVGYTGFDSDDNVTLATAAAPNAQFFDFIEVTGGAPVQGDVLNTGSELVSVQEPIDGTLVDPNTLQVGDVLNIGGVDYTVTTTATTEGSITHDNGAITTPGKIVHVGLTDGTNTVDYVFPIDGANFENITSMSIDGPLQPTTIPVVEGDTNEIVTLAAASTPVTIYDAIQMTGPIGLGDVFTTGTELVDVLEPLVFNAANPNTIDVGDTVEIGGVTYTVDFIGNVSADITNDNGVTPVGKIDSVVLTDALGNEINLLVPLDGFGNLPNITQIEATAVDITGNNISVADSDNNDIVTLAEPQALVILHDVILVENGFGGSMDSGTDLVSVTDGVAFGLSNASTVAVGDSFFLGGVEYTIDTMTEAGTTTTYDGGTSAQMVVNQITGTDVNGTQVQIIIPDEVNVSTTQVDYPLISNITVNGGNGITSFAVSDANDNNDVTLAEPVTNLTFFDFIEMSVGTPAVGDVLDSGTELVSVQEPVTATLSDPTIVSVGDTFVIGTVTYTVTATNVLTGTATYDGGLTASAKFAQYELSDGVNTVNYMVPQDNAGDLPDITSIEILGIEAGSSNVPGVVDTNDNVTLAAVGTDVNLYDFIELSGGVPADNAVLTTGPDLVEIDEPVIATLADPTLIAVNDTMEIGGVTYTVTDIQTYEETTVVYDGGASTAVVNALGVTLEDSAGNIINYIAPVDTAGPLPDITEITVATVTTGIPQIGSERVDEDDNVTLATTTDVQLYDFIQLNDVYPGGVGVLHACDDMTLVEDNVVATLADPNTIEVGDIINVGGTEYEVTYATTVGSTYTYDGGQTQAVNSALFTLTDTATGVETGFIAPIDTGGALPLISEIELSGFATNVGVPVVNVDDNNIVTLVEPDFIVEGTAGNDVIDLAYDGDPECDRVDALDHSDGSNDDSIEGYEGDDLIYGLDGDDTIDAGADNDTVYGGVGHDSILGGLGNDQIEGGSEDDTIEGGAGDDVIDGGADNDSINGGADQDLIFGGMGADTLLGATGDDTVDGGTGNDEINLGEGADVGIGGEGSDTLLGGLGNDSIFGDNPEAVVIGGGAAQGTGNSGAEVTNLTDMPSDQFTFEMQFCGDAMATTGPTQSPNTATLVSYATTSEASEFVLYAVSDNEEYDLTTTDDLTDTIFETGYLTLQVNGATYTTGIETNTVLDGGDTSVSVAFDATAGTAVIYVDGILTETVTLDDGDPLTTDDSDPMEAGGTLQFGQGQDGTGGFTGKINDARLWDDVRNEDEILEFHNVPLEDEAGEANLVSNWTPDPFTGAFTDDVGGNDMSAFGSVEVTTSGVDGNDVIGGEEGDDLLLGAGGNDSIEGGADNDTILGGSGDDKLAGDDGEDLLYGNSGTDNVSGGTGDDQIFVSDGAGENDTVDAGDDRDVIYGDSGDSVHGGAGGDDFDTLNLSGSTSPGGSLAVTITGADSNGNGSDGFVTYYDSTGAVEGTLTFTEIELVVPCFTPGTMIKTKRGEVAVEKLRVGDSVLTADNGYQQLEWIGTKALTGSELSAKPHFNPIRISQGALGNGLPERDMLVSPQHRMLLNTPDAALWFGSAEVLVAAKHLTVLEGIDVVEADDVTYIHIMCNAHEIVCADGTWSESFQPGDMTLAGMDSDIREELMALFPELSVAQMKEQYQSARLTLKAHEANVLLGNL